jgi:hypothetical protein
MITVGHPEVAENPFRLNYLPSCSKGWFKPPQVSAHPVFFRVCQGKVLGQGVGEALEVVLGVFGVKQFPDNRKPSCPP